MNNCHCIPPLADMLAGKPVSFAPRGQVSRTYRVHGAYEYYRANKTDVALHRDIWEKVNDCELPSGFQINHIDGCKLNNDPANLEAVTQSGADYKDWLRRWRRTDPAAL